MNLERTKKYVEEFNAAKVSALVLAGEVPGLIAEIERLRRLTINPGSTLHGSTITAIAAEREALRSQLIGMTGEHDSERAIAQEWETKLNDLLDRYDMLTTAYNEEVARVGRLQERLRFIVRACEDPTLPRDSRADAVADVARKALCL